MAIFAIIKQPSPTPTALGAAVARSFPNSHYVLSDSAWLVAGQGTAIDISAKLDLGPGATGTGIVVEIGSYYGKANPAIWTWIKENWEASASG